MSMDLSHLSVIDEHAHPFLPEKEVDDARAYWTTSLLPENAEHIKYLLVYRKMISRLASLMGEDVRQDEAVLWKRRNDLYRSDPQKYIRLLFEDAKIDSVFIDIGYPTQVISGYDVAPDVFARLVPCGVKVIVRIEPIIMALAGQGLGFTEYMDAFTRAVEEKIAAHDVVALKTAIAYFAGLDLKKCCDSDISASFEAYMKNPGDFSQAGPFLSHMVHRTFEIARRNGLPVQIHTGFGNAPLLNLAASNPVLLFDLLSDEEIRKTPIVLLHAGYPFVREIAYLVNNYPNLRVDISQVSQFIGVGLPGLLTDLLSMVPINKILYGSDGLGAPELFWWPAHHARSCLGTALGKLISDGLVGTKDAEEIAVRLLRQNAEELYL